METSMKQELSNNAECRSVQAAVASTAPSARQKERILALARTAGLKVDLSSVKDSDSAARLINSLRLLVMRTTTDESSVRENRKAFALAVRVVAAIYVRRQRRILGSKTFWHDVHTFHHEFLRNQDLAM